MMNPTRLFPLLLLLFAHTALSAERALRFSDRTSPEGGSVILVIEADGSGTSAREALDQIVGGAIGRTLADQALEPGQERTLHALGPFRTVTLIRARDSGERRGILEDIGGRAAQIAALDPSPDVILIWDGAGATATDGAHLAFGAALGQYRFDRYRSAPDEGTPDGATLTIAVANPQAARDHYEARWQPVVDAVRFTRDLISEPANVIYPESFVARTRQAFEGMGKVKIRVLDEAEIEKMGMGALAGVGQGSSRPPRLLAVHYRGGRRDDAPLAFVGKGITFDTGGISLKNGNSVWKMKYDMAGAAAAIGSVLALAGRGAEINAVGIAALAENMPSGTAQRPGDVVRTGSGKTIEVLNTDAEGRLVLSDGVWFAQQEYQPAVLVDLATLTGSVTVALGDEYAGAFSRDAELVQGLIAAGEASGELLWHLPLHPSYAEDIESDIADIKNISGHRLAGAGVGAQVIGTFVEETQPWVHLDIAGMAWKEKETATVPKGAVGFGVRLLDTWADSYLAQ